MAPGLLTFITSRNDLYIKPGWGLDNSETTDRKSTFEAGDKLDIGTIGFTLNSQVTDNIVMRTSYSSNVFGDNDLNTSMIRMQFVYAWHPTSENMKKLRGGH